MFTGGKLQRDLEWLVLVGPSFLCSHFRPAARHERLCKLWGEQSNRTIFLILFDMEGKPFSFIFQFTNERAGKFAWQEGKPLCGVQFVQEAFFGVLQRYNSILLLSSITLLFLCFYWCLYTENNSNMLSKTRFPIFRLDVLGCLIHDHLQRFQHCMLEASFSS